MTTITNTTGETVVDFDLPEVAPSTTTSPRVHIGGSTCLSCEG